MLKLRKLSCHVIELSDKEAYEVGLVENLQHKTMNPVEESFAFKKYVEGYGWGGVSELAKQIGKSQEFVTKRIQLLLLPKEIQEEIIRRRITPSVALELLPFDAESVREIGEFVIKQLSLRLGKESSQRFMKENLMTISLPQTPMMTMNSSIQITQHMSENYICSMTPHEINHHYEIYSSRL